MKNLRERLQTGDPARTARPLDADEVTAIRRAMAAAEREPRRWPIATGLALAATGLAAVALVLLWPKEPPPPTPVVVVAPAPVVQAAPVPAPVVAERRVPRPRKAVPPPAPPAPRVPVREVRFVTASGTQILWTFRSFEEGA